MSIGAVAVAGGRIVAGERFERLVDPGRLIGAVAARVHGITDEVVRGQPALPAVLLEFRRFAQGAVLVAHNAAFDLRFLKLKERETGIRFDQPV